MGDLAYWPAAKPLSKKNINFNDPEIFNYINIYFSNRNLNNNFVSFLP